MKKENEYKAQTRFDLKKILPNLVNVSYELSSDLEKIVTEVMDFENNELNNLVDLKVKKIQKLAFKLYLELDFLEKITQN